MYLYMFFICMCLWFMYTYRNISDISFSTRNNHLGGDAILRLALAFAQHKNIQKIKVGLAPKSCSIFYVSYTV